MGAMGESSRKVQIASTYMTGSILIYIAVVHSDISIANVDASTLPNVEHWKCPGTFPHGGNGGKFKESSGMMYLHTAAIDVRMYKPQSAHT